MRIAVTGTHGSGKSTLIEDFLEVCPRYQALPEPYWDMVEAGAVFADPPTEGDYQAQLAHSIATLLASGGEPDVIFERCPLDFVAYLDAIGDADEFSPSGRELSRLEAALTRLDLIVYLPLSVPDEIAVAVELPALRRRVDQRLRRILEDDELGLLAEGPPVVALRGSPRERLERLLSATGDNLQI